MVDQRNILDVKEIGELNTITADGDYLRIGSQVTWTDVINADLSSAFDGLKFAAREVGSVQIQNRASVAGNCPQSRIF